MKQAFIFWPKQFIKENEPAETETVIDVNNELKLDGKIIDIYSFQ